MKKLVTVKTTVSTVTADGLKRIKELNNKIVAYDPTTYKFIKAKTQKDLEDNYFHVVEIDISDFVNCNEKGVEIPVALMDILNSIKELTGEEVVVNVISNPSEIDLSFVATRTEAKQDENK